jgi:CDP-diacylglycerol--glycerol-3-phosphate 3-phosphatidyltransferase
MWTISNLLSFVRLLLAAPMAMLLMDSHYLSAILLGAVAVITDLLDGYLARKLNQISEFGKIIDPVADKFVMASVVIPLALNNIIPMWFLCAVVARDLIIMIGGLYAKGKIGLVIPSNYVGKTTVIILTLTLTGIILNVPGFATYGIFVALGALLFSLIVYGLQMFQKIKIAEQQKAQSSE